MNSGHWGVSSRTKHVDHIFPAARFTDSRLKGASVPDEKIPDFKDFKDRLANLQLLQGAVNIEKSATMPAEWLTQTHSNDSSRREYEERHLLGHVPQSIGSIRHLLQSEEGTAEGQDPATPGTASAAVSDRVD